MGYGPISHGPIAYKPVNIRPYTYWTHVGPVGESDVYIMYYDNN